MQFTSSELSRVGDGIDECVLSVLFCASLLRKNCIFQPHSFTTIHWYTEVSMINMMLFWSFNKTFIIQHLIQHVTCGQVTWNKMLLWQYQILFIAIKPCWLLNVHNTIYLYSFAHLENVYFYKFCTWFGNHRTALLLVI